MKGSKRKDLARRRIALVAQIANQRAGLEQQAAALRLAARVIDKINDGIQHLKKHPEILLLPLAITLVSRPRRLMALGISGLGLWKLLRNWRRLLLS